MAAESRRKVLAEYSETLVICAYLDALEKVAAPGVKPRMFGRLRSPQPWPGAPEGQRAYVVGDVHGRLDLLDALLERIHRELDERPPDKAMLVFLGDLVDRGPSSAQVVERLRTYHRPGLRTVFLLGNHEEVLPVCCPARRR